MRRSNFILLILLSSFPALAAVKGEMDLSKTTSEVTFLAKGHPSALHINGTAKSEHPLEGTLVADGTTLKGTAKLALDTLDTGIGMRTTHMKEKFLETAKFPTAELTFDAVKVGAENTPFTGTLTLHGQKKPVSGVATVKENGELLEADFAFPVKTDEHGIEKASFMGISVEETVAVKVHVSGAVAGKTGKI